MKRKDVDDTSKPKKKVRFQENKDKLETELERAESPEIFNDSDSDIEEPKEFEDQDYDKIEGEEDLDKEELAEDEIEPFNLKSEMREGRFENGFYIKNKEDVDEWLTGITKEDIKKAALAQQKKSKIKEKEPRDENILFKELFYKLKPNETVSDLIRRDVSSVDTVSELDDYTIYDKSYYDIEEVLVNKGVFKLKRRILYEYLLHGEVYGKFSFKEITEWVNYGYFNNVDVKVRRVREEFEGGFTCLDDDFLELSEVGFLE